jgi:hypothetical protein
MMNVSTPFSLCRRARPRRRAFADSGSILGDHSEGKYASDRVYSDEKDDLYEFERTHSEGLAFADGEAREVRNLLRDGGEEAGPFAVNRRRDHDVSEGKYASDRVYSDEKDDLYEFERTHSETYSQRVRRGARGAESAARWWRRSRSLCRKSSAGSRCSS